MVWKILHDGRYGILRKFPVEMFTNWLSINQQLVLYSHPYTVHCSRVLKI